MPASPWLTLRQAKEALQNGRPDEAHRALAPLVGEGHRKAWQLTRDVAIAYTQRGERYLRADNTDAAWKELLAAESLNTGEMPVAGLRTALTRIGLAECRAALEAGRPLHVVETVARLRERNTQHPELNAIEAAAQDWVLAAEMADRGDFLLAKTTSDRIRARLTGPPTGLNRFLAELDGRHERFREAVGQLTDAAEAQNWRNAARAADAVVAVAPNHREARHAQMRAWEAVSPMTMAYVPKQEPAELDPEPPPPASGLPKRFLLWVDGVGGYLVCLSNRISFGQATADGPIDVPLFADLSRLHAEVSRDGEGYVLESARGAHVNGTPTDRSTLKCGDRVTLGQTCQFLFRQPVSISPSARLELVSGHRLPLAVDGVLLMADNLILGPGDQVHVCLPWLAANVIIYRSKDGLGVRIPGSFRVDNSPCRDRANLTLPAVVSSDSFTFAIEPVGVRL